MINNWTARESGGCKLTTEAIGLIEIYRDPKSGLCIDINGKRAWSCFRDCEESAKLYVIGKVRDWQYINSFST